MVGLKSAYAGEKNLRNKNFYRGLKLKHFFPNTRIPKRLFDKPVISDEHDKSVALIGIRSSLSHFLQHCKRDSSTFFVSCKCPICPIQIVFSDHPESDRIS
jgi:hypothetical protein